MPVTVCKFGGSSVESAGQIKKLKEILSLDASRRFVVVSAPGREQVFGEKITDHLFNIATEGEHLRSRRPPVSARESVEAVGGKFKKLIDDLGVKGDDLLKELHESLEKTVEPEKRNAYMASRGEHFNARLIARYLEKEGMPAGVLLPEEVGFIVSDNYDDAKIQPQTHRNIEKLKNYDKIGIIPGYYGVTRKGDVSVFSRGGSDLTGGEFAYGLKADLYENWTDTNGIYEADPRIIKRARVIPRLTYKEIRLLSSKGFDVFHFDAMVNCKKRNIPINIRNTNNIDEPGTLILTERVPEELIAGIARMDGVAYIHFEKDTLGETGTFTKELLDILKEYEIQTYHYPTDKDDIAVLLNQHDLSGKINELRRDLVDRLQPDSVRIQYDLSIISPVGIGMRNVPGVIAEATTALKERNISVETIDQGPAQISFHIGVLSAYADDALEALFSRLIEEQSLKVIV